MANKVGTPKPKTRTYTIGGLVRAVEGAEFSKPQVCYEFSDGNRKVETDRTQNGFYKR